ncbi:CHASE2 domain-containing protein [Sulfuricurvum sp.]|uniref:CHASE2 domain-containing protein n=1 Tax=Sulfuricurvum sp. TaxID=2025608 RepID=UPI002E30A45D|nr:CHASE2 domain-containing protein [Sulfuricurvum sp.]HEX5330489.1 CHASE2 domain-containing protein [Sulfuricurvum sp.]
MRAVSITSAALIATVLYYMLWWSAPLLAYFDHKLYDHLNSAFPTAHTPDSTIVVEIDDKSLKAFGQWPWPRMITAKLIDTLSRANPSAVVLDMVFAEKDRSSPQTIEAYYRDVLDLNISISGIPRELRDNDAILADTIGSTKTILPVFSDGSSEGEGCSVPHLVNVYSAFERDRLYTIDSLVCSMPIYQHRASRIGHIHALADSDGTFRRVSMLVRHKDELIPTLGVAAVASVSPSVQTFPVSVFRGDMGLEVAGEDARMDKEGSALLTFYPRESYSRVSAYDLLSGTVDPARLRGKFVLIGGTALGLDTWHTISDGTMIAGVYVHATVIENLLNGDMRVQPSLYPKLNIILSCMIATGLLLLMRRKRYLSVLAVVFIVTAIASGVTYRLWGEGIYPSVGYLIVPLLLYLFVLALLMFFIDYRNKKRFIEEIGRNEEEIAYQKAMLFQQSKLAAMGEMIDNIAHQWRQPLNLLGVIIQESEYAYGAGKVDREYLRKMSSESMEQILFMSQTIEDFRNFVKPDQINAPFDLNESVEQSIRLLSAMFESHSIGIDVHYSQEPMSLWGSHSELKQVMINLLQNARDALIENRISAPAITVRVFGDHTYGAVSVQDNGGGIAPEVMERIFEPYFTTKEEGKGSGIGLYMSYAIIRTKMGGMISASNVENGTVFTIMIPLYTPPSS